MAKLKRKKYITLLIVPDDNSSVFNLKMRSFVFWSLIFLWLGGLFASFYIISKYVNYQYTLQYNKFLEKKHREFAKEILNAKETVKRVSEIEKQLRDLLQLKSKNAIIKYTGFGGPALIDSELLEKEVKDENAIISRKAFELAVKFVDEQASENEKNFQKIIEYITEQRAKLTAVPAGWPVKGWITCGFGSRIDPFTGVLSFHEGVDIANDLGTPVKATADGIVSFVGWEPGYGNMVTINHGNGYTTRFGHLLKYVVKLGQLIKKEQIIGYLGESGRSTAPHLHYEVRLNGVAVNPAKYLNKDIALK